MVFELDRKVMGFILQAIPDGIVVVDRQGKFIQWNAAAEDILGVGLDIQTSPDSWAEHYGIYLPDQVTPCPVKQFPLLRALKDEAVDDFLLFLRRGGDAADRWINVSARPLLDTMGYQIGALAIFQDVTAKRRAERAASESREMWRALVQGSPELILNLDGTGKIVFANRPLFNLPPEGLVGRRWLDFVQEEFQTLMSEAMVSAERMGSQRAIEVVLRSTQGTPAWFSVSLGAVGREGAVGGIMLIANDVTQKKQIESQQVISDRMASLGTLAAGMAHEINNPLAALTANVDLALRDLDDLPAGATRDDLKSGLEDAKIAAEHLKNIIKDLRVFSRTDDQVVHPLDVEKVLESCIRMTRNEIRHRAELACDYRPTPLVMANESKLGQVFVNLLMNAVQAIGEGPVERNRITVRTFTEEGWVNVEIEDTGAGMDPTVLNRLFSPFFTTKPVGEGTGLGLSICHRIVTSFDGQISARSEVGRGSTFTIRLKPSLVARPDPARRAYDGRAAVRGTLLMVDDEVLLTQSLERILAPHHDVLVANTVHDALEAVERRGDGIDAILCDLMMPRTGGVEFYRALERTRPALLRRIVFMTGGAFSPSAQKFLASVPNARLQKPFETLELLNALQTVIRTEVLKEEAPNAHP